MWTGDANESRVDWGKAARQHIRLTQPSKELTKVDIAERSATDFPSQPVFIANPQFHRSSIIYYTQNVVRSRSGSGDDDGGDDGGGGSGGGSSSSGRVAVADGSRTRSGGVNRTRATATTQRGNVCWRRSLSSRPSSAAHSGHVDCTLIIIICRLFAVRSCAYGVCVCVLSVGTCLCVCVCCSWRACVRA